VFNCRGDAGTKLRTRELRAASQGYRILVEDAERNSG